MPDAKKVIKPKPTATVELWSVDGKPIGSYTISNAIIKLKGESTFDGITEINKMTLSVSGSATPTKVE